MNTPILLASARPGVHQVKVYRHGFVETFVYARVRKQVFRHPQLVYLKFTNKEELLSNILDMAHTTLEIVKRVRELQQ